MLPLAGGACLADVGGGKDRMGSSPYGVKGAKFILNQCASFVLARCRT